MNFQEIVEKLKELEYSKYEIGSGDFEEDVFGPTREVYSQGGEGEGENWKRVYFFEDHDVYLSMSGHYSSYVGVNLDDSEPEEVRPVQKLTTYYK